MDCCYFLVRKSSKISKISPVHLNPILWQGGVALQRVKAMASTEHEAENHRGATNAILLSSTSPHKGNKCYSSLVQLSRGQQMLFLSNQPLTKRELTLNGAPGKVEPKPTSKIGEGGSFCTEKKSPGFLNWPIRQSTIWTLCPWEKLLSWFSNKNQQLNWKYAKKTPLVHWRTGTFWMVQKVLVMFPISLKVSECWCEDSVEIQLHPPLSRTVYCCWQQQIYN